MPFLDVTDVLLDPDFADTIGVIRRTEVVNSYGEAQVYDKPDFNIIAVVTTPGANELSRLPEYATFTNTISVITKFPLRSASQENSADNYQPDLIVYQNTKYVVNHVDDYTQYGPGFVQAICTELAFTSRAPA